MKRRKNETLEQYAERRAKRSERFSNFALAFSIMCWVLIVLKKIIVIFG